MSGYNSFQGYNVFDGAAGNNELTDNLAIRKPVFSVGILNEAIQNEVDAMFTVKKPRFHANIQNGELVFIFNQDTNYTQKSLSTNYSQG